MISCTPDSTSSVSSPKFRRWFNLYLERCWRWEGLPHSNAPYEDIADEMDALWRDPDIRRALEGRGTGEISGEPEYRLRCDVAAANGHVENGKPILNRKI